MPTQYAMTAEIFLEFVYPETKDLCKSFLTLVAGILVFSVTFSEKIVDFASAGRVARTLLVSAWASFMAAIIAGGGALTMLFLAGGGARNHEAGWQDVMVTGGYSLFTAGFLFVAGLLCLVLAATVAVRNSPTPGPDKLTEPPKRDIATVVKQDA